MQPRGRKGKPKPFSLSLFEWELGNQKEKELVGEGHQVATQNRETIAISAMVSSGCPYMKFFCVSRQG